MRFRFAPAAPDEQTVFGAERPGYSDESVPPYAVNEWIDFMREHGIRRVCCLLSQAQLAFYKEDLLGSYAKSCGTDNVCHVPVTDLHLVSASDLETKILPFLRDSDHRELPVVVHCSGGSGRTGHVLAAWLARERHLSAEDALATVLNTPRDPYEAVKQGHATERELIRLVSGDQKGAGA